MKSNFFLQVIILLFCMNVAFPTAAREIPSADAQKWVEDKGHRLLNAFVEPDIVKKYAALDDMLLSYIDLDYVSRFVMGKYWRQMRPEQQVEYQALFKRYALSVYKSFPLNFDSTAISFEIVKATPEENGATVRAKIKINAADSQGQPPVSDIFVDFKLTEKNGEIKIIDLKLGESSLILAYRSRFYEMIAKNDNDIDWFLEDLTDITDAAERTNQECLRQTEY